MKTIKAAHLFVEKYSKSNREILLDFVREDEFIYFKQNTDYSDNMHLSHYEPTMLLIHNCNPSQKIREGSMLTVSMDKLLHLKQEQISFENNIEQRQELLPAIVFLEIHNGEAFADLIDASESSVSTYIGEEFIHNFSSSWNGPPCALERIHDHFELRVWDVGQGSTVSISDGKHLTLFDFGASIYYSKDKLKRILADHDQLLNKHCRCSLIISHWDIDHYNFLTVVEDKFLERICCIFYPSTVTTLTAQQIVKRIESHCNYRVAIKPAPHTTKSSCGIHPVISSKHYTLFTGEESRSCNRSGLLLALCSNNQNALLTADHSNYQIWGQAYNYLTDKQKLLHIVVPHHGGDCGKPAMPSIDYPGKAVISVGSNNYGHPKATTIRQYTNEQFDLIRTDRCGVDIVINMN